MNYLATAREKFANFHFENPNVFRRLRERCWDLKAVGHKTYRIDLLIGELVVKYDERTSDRKFGINNNHRPYYARLLNKQPGLEGFFKTRAMTGE